MFPSAPPWLELWIAGEPEALPSGLVHWMRVGLLESLRPLVIAFPPFCAVRRRPELAPEYWGVVMGYHESGQLGISPFPPVKVAAVAQAWTISVEPSEFEVVGFRKGLDHAAVTEIFRAVSN